MLKPCRRLSLRGQEPPTTCQVSWLLSFLPEGTSISKNFPCSVSRDPRWSPLWRSDFQLLLSHLPRPTELMRRRQSGLGGSTPPKKRSRRPLNPVPVATCRWKNMVSLGWARSEGVSGRRLCGWDSQGLYEGLLAGEFSSGTLAPSGQSLSLSSLTSSFLAS